MQIIDIFYNLAKQHKNIRAFKYGKGYEKGAGHDLYPLVWVDDPIMANNINAFGILNYTLNFDVLDIPTKEEEVPDIQTSAMLTGMSFAQRISEINATELVNIKSYSFLTLRDYYDDNAAGVRFTFNLTAPVPLDLCEEAFIGGKEFENIQDLPEFRTDNARGCAIFSDKEGLPKFEI